MKAGHPIFMFFASSCWSPLMLSGRSPKAPNAGLI
jgi:hypothetical protein